MPLFDTHCHYNLEPLYSGDTSDPWLQRFKLPETYPNWQSHWESAKNAGVGKSVVVGTEISTSKLALEIAQKDPDLYPAVAIHPGHIEELEENLETSLAELESLVNPSVVAIGETGLDYFRLPDGPQAEVIKTNQKRSFEAHIGLANEHVLPLILHVRDQASPETPTPGNAYWDVLEVVQKHYHWQRPVVLHCVSGPLAYVQAMVEIGAYVGIAGNTTYPSSDQIRRLILNTPTDRMLLETDAPFLAPQQNRGELCEPWMISQTAQFLESELRLDLNRIWANSLEFFQIS
jgi:TatD DNase family protein